MPVPRTADQRAAFVRTTVAELDVAPDLAERLLALSEAGRAREISGHLDDVRRRWLLAELLDDELCRHAWWVAAAEGELLWRELLDSARPPHEAGPALLVAVALATRDASDAAFELIRHALRSCRQRRSLLELGVDLAEDAGSAELAWSWVTRLGVDEADGRWADLRLVAAGHRGRGAGRSAGIVHARWLRRRADRWTRRSWSPLSGAPPDPAESRIAADPVAAAAVDYLRGRSPLLPLVEKDLLRRWARTARRHFTVARLGQDRLVLEDSGRPRVVGWEGDAPSELARPAVVDGWLLPTLVAGEGLFVSCSRPPGGDR